MRTILLLLPLFFTTQAKAIIPDGVTFRLGSWFNEHVISMGPVHIDDKNEIPITKIPINVAFKEKLLSPNTFFQLFLDVEIPSRSSNFKAADDNNRTEIISNFLRSSETSFTSSNPNWDISADMRTWSIAFGFQYGIFIKSGKARFLKTALGLNIGYIYYNIDLNLCSSFIGNNSSVSLTEKSSGTCFDKTRIDNFRYSGLGFGASLMLTLYEKESGDNRFVFMNLSFGSVAATTPDGITSRPGNHKLEVSTTFGSVDVISYTWIF